MLKALKNIKMKGKCRHMYGLYKSYIAIPLEEQEKIKPKCALNGKKELILTGTADNIKSLVLAKGYYRTSIERLMTVYAVTEYYIIDTVSKKVVGLSKMKIDVVGMPEYTVIGTFENMKNSIDFCKSSKEKSYLSF